MEWLQQLPWLHYLSGPLIGAVIGYFTNYIAVKMLFRPRRAVMLGKWRLPLTPGIIPKRQPQLAHAIGQAVGQQLLTEADVKATLLTEEMKATVADSVLESISGKGHTVEELLRRGMGEEVFTSTKEALTARLCEKLEKEICRMDLGATIAEHSAAAIRERVSGTMLSIFVRSSSVESVANSIQEGVNRYLEENLHEVLLPKVRDEIDAFTAKPTKELSGAIATDSQIIRQVVGRAYEEIVLSKADHFLHAVNVADIVETKINEMDVETIEKLTLSVLKHELQAIVSLGALIGLVIGVLNIFLN